MHMACAGGEYIVGTGRSWGTHELVCCMQTDDRPALVAEGDYINGGQTKEAIAAAVKVFTSTEAAEAEAAAKLDAELAGAIRNPVGHTAPGAPAASSDASAIRVPTATSSVTRGTTAPPPSATPAVTRDASFAPPSVTSATLPVPPVAAGPAQVIYIAMLVIALMQTKHKPLRIAAAV